LRDRRWQNRQNAILRFSIPNTRISTAFATSSRDCAPGGCPWDREQTHESLLPPLIEEAYEVAGSVYANDTANFREELAIFFCSS
jgi:uncharacterized protein YabN with tetrapyrrole methylase and pyrophosphatase domain